MSNRVFRTKSAAEYVGLAPSTLEKMRISGEGPTFVRLTGRAIGYAREDLDDFVEHRKARSTSEPRAT